MPHFLENVFTAEAVRAWSPIVRTAWRDRKINPDGYLRALPPPGQRLATGPWTAQEEALFETRLADFRANSWPLSYWGLFSLALPHRTGSQCRHFYRQSLQYRAEEEAASLPLAAVRACLAAHRPQTAHLWASEVAAQVEARVDAWLQGKSTPGSSGVKGAGPGGRPAAAAPLPLPLSSFAFRQPEQQQQQSGGRTKPGLGPRPPNQKPAAAPPRQKKAAAAAKPAPPPKRRARAIDSDDDDDEFVAGTLRKIKAVEKRAPPPGPAPAGAAPAASGRAKAATGGKRVKCGVGSGATIVKKATVAAGDDFGGGGGGAVADTISVIRLDKAGALPGWARQVRPYAPPGAAPAPPPGALVAAPDLLRFDFGSLGAGAFCGAIVNAPLAADPGKGVTPTQLAAMRLPDCLAADALVCVWAPKAAVGETAAAMAAAWDCKYVENLTWVHLGPGGGVARAPAPLLAASHSTLLMGRRGRGALELRHQRTPDVVVGPALGGGRFPDAAREMLETLLPEGKGGGGGGGGRAQGAPRFLEVAFHGAEPGARPGWVKLVQGGEGEG